MKGLSAVIVVAAGLAAGCASRGYEKSQDTASAMQDASASAIAFSTARQSAFDALNNLASEPHEGLPGKFEAFSSATDSVASAEANLRSSIAGMKSAAAARFQAWEKENATFTNDAIRTRSQQRLAEAQGVVAKAGTDSDAMLEQSGAFVSYLSDLKKLLANDLTPKGITSNADLVQNARASNGRLHQMGQPTLASLNAAAEALTTK